MHEWKTRTSSSRKRLEEIFTFTHETDDGYDTVRGVTWENKEFTNEEEAQAYCQRRSYGSDYACGVTIVKGKKSKAYLNALERYNTRKKEYDTFNRELSMAYGRTSEKTTCPNCKSSINTKYAAVRHFRTCPVCGSMEVISKSNWEKLALKERLAEEAEANLGKEAQKCGIYYLASFEWHC